MTTNHRTPGFWRFSVPSSTGMQNTASSTSRASSPSMVTKGTSRRSTRPFNSDGLTVGGTLAACCSDASENSCGTSNLRTAISISMPGSSISPRRSEEHTSELQSLMRISYAVFCLKKKTTTQQNQYKTEQTTTNTHLENAPHLEH